MGPQLFDKVYWIEGSHEKSKWVEAPGPNSIWDIAAIYFFWDLYPDKRDCNQEWECSQQASCRECNQQILRSLLSTPPHPIRLVCGPHLIIVSFWVYIMFKRSRQRGTLPPSHLGSAYTLATNITFCFNNTKRSAKGTHFFGLIFYCDNIVTNEIMPEKIAQD